jgi:hypothetical protein
MPQRHKPPILTGAKIKTGATIGKGQKEPFSQPVKKVLIRGKNIFRGLIKNLNRGSRDPSHIPRKAAIRGQLAWRTMWKAGLPVPEISKIDLRKGSKQYLHLFVEDLRKHYGKLEDCHERGQPIFFKKFSFPKDKRLLTHLANDIATIHSLGYTPDNVDFWHFYKKGTSWGRVIIDFDGFRKTKRENHIHQSIANVYDISTYLGTKSEAFKFFVKEYSKTCHDRELGSIIQKQYDYDKFEYLDSRYAE